MTRLRNFVGGILSRWADRLLYGEGHTLTLRDGSGAAIFTLTTSGGYAAMDPPPPYSVECCHD